MLADRRERHRQRFRQFADRHAPPAEPNNDGPARGIGQSVKHMVEVDQMIKHMLYYLGCKI